MIDRLYNRLAAPDNRWEVVFWLLVLLEAPLSGYLLEVQGFREATILRIVGLITKMAAAYGIALYVIPWLFARRYGKAVLLLFLLVTLLPLVARFLNVHVAEVAVGYRGYRESLWEMIQQYDYTFGAYFFRVFAFTFWFVFFRVGVDYYRGQRERARMELNALKAQIQPHFLFNTLNNLYLLTLERAEEAPDVVLRLSKLLEYILYRGKETRVSLEEEIQLLDNYLELERIRYGDRLTVTFNRQVSDPKQEVAPLLLLPPLENAFKHGLSTQSGEQWLRIDLRADDKALTYRVENPLPTGKSTPSGGGIGQENLRSQLKLLYPDRHTLTISEYDNVYAVQLTLEL